MKDNNYIFTSERLGFRQWTIEDLDAFAEMNADEDVMEHFPSTRTRAEVADLINRLKAHFKTNGFTYYATEILETQEFIGMIGMAHQKYETAFTPAIDIGWRLKKGAWGKGYATEGARRCLDYGFNELGMTSIISVCVINNTKSEHVMKKLGMKKIGAFDHPDLKDHPEYEAHVCYEIKKG